MKKITLFLSFYSKTRLYIGERWKIKCRQQKINHDVKIRHTCIDFLNKSDVKIIYENKAK